MFPREARKTRSTSRSSSVRTQNSHAANPPESSVSQAGQLSRVTARRWLQTGQLVGGRRVGVFATLFHRHVDGAHRAVAIERPVTRAERELVAARRANPADGNVAHHGVGLDSHARRLFENDLNLAHLAPDCAGTAVEAAGCGHVARGHVQLERTSKFADAAVAGLDIALHRALQPADAEIAGLDLGRQRKGWVHANGQLSADIEAGDENPSSRLAEGKAGFVRKRGLLDDHGVPLLTGGVRTVCHGAGHAGVAKDLRVAEAADEPDLLDRASRLAGGRRRLGRGRRWIRLQSFHAGRSFLGRDRPGGHLAQDFTSWVVHYNKLETQSYQFVKCERKTDARELGDKLITACERRHVRGLGGPSLRSSSPRPHVSRACPGTSSRPTRRSTFASFASRSPRFPAGSPRSRASVGSSRSPSRPSGACWPTATAES